MVTNSYSLIANAVFSFFLYNSAYSSDLQIRENSKFFVRLNLKLNSVDDTKVFAYAIGYRVNFDLRKSKNSRMYLDGRNAADAYFHPEHIRESTKRLFHSFGWNGTACVARTLCEIQQLDEFSSDLLGAALRLLYLLVTSCTPAREVQRVTKDFVQTECIVRYRYSTLSNKAINLLMKISDSYTKNNAFQSKMVIVLSNEIRPNADAVRELYREYNMTEDGVRRDVSHIRQWMAKQAHLPRVPPAKDDEINNWIEGYLRLTKNSVERTKIAIDSYFKGKNLFCDVFSIPDFRTYVHSEVFNNVYMMLLPNLTPDGLKILLYGVTSDDPSLFQPVDFFRRMAMVLDIQQKLGIDFTGIRVILYARHGTLSHLAQFDLLLLKRVFKLARKAYPIRLKHTHIVYAPMFIEAAIKIIKPFISKKVMSRVSIHKGAESLWHYIPKDNLPADFGGNLPTMSALHDLWRQKLLDHYDWFIENRSLVADETKRVKKENKIEKCANNGTFRELSFD